MSRLEVLIRRPKQTLVVLAVVLAAVGVVVGSGAAFTAQASNLNNTFAAGTLSLTNTPNTAIFSVSGWKPGDSAQGVIDLQNSGSITAGAVTLRATSVTDTPASPALSAKVDMVVKDCGLFAGATPPTCDAGDPNVYSGTLAAMTSANALGSYAANDKHRYQFTATFNSSADDTYQGAQTSATFQWDATS
jgi:hypothetical protein